ncbi:MAG: TIR domain-containing protein [Chloroflexi bacterium]|nr:MAG: TIR domain-containing protein [Chloroflexota bacterium]MBL1196364.1 TIR domain-containing protein [Chloroflexota bacterium]NOH13659.1 TIR domain-containing protein [Chloroflexota bacterium]
MAKHGQLDQSYESLPDIPGYRPEPVDGVRVGENPIPGLTLKRVLAGHSDAIYKLAWSPDGRFLASPSKDTTIRIWNVATANCVAVLNAHKKPVTSIAWSPDTEFLVSSEYGGNKILLWDTTSWELLRVFERDDEWKDTGIAWSPDSRFFAAGIDDGYIGVWNRDENFEMIILPIQKSRNPDDHVLDVAWSSHGQLAFSTEFEGIQIWNPLKLELINELSKPEHLPALDIGWSKNQEYFISASIDGNINFRNASSLKLDRVIEGHTAPITSLSESPDKKILVTKGGFAFQAGTYDDIVSFWDLKKGIHLASIHEKQNRIEPYNLGSIAFHPNHSYLATLGEYDKKIRIWEFESDALLNQKTADSISYTTAKIVLVGDSGVGKTGLGWRLAHNEFKEHASTHGQQFWVIPKLGKKRKDGTECEAVLWDLAGQPDYRLVHSLFLEDVDTALILFDPTNRQEPLSGVDFWISQLKRNKNDLCNTILVGARSDRSISTLTEDELIAYCERNAISGGFVATSAFEGEGVNELVERLQAQIPWEAMTTTVTTQTFKRIKEYVLELKEQSKSGNLLVQPEELRGKLQKTDTEWQFNNAEMMTAIGHLANHGYVTVLRGSQGDKFVLLAPDLLTNLASSMVLEARRNPRGLGVLDESRLLMGDYAFLELHELNENESEILLDAAAVLFLEHNLCFRETFNEQTFLVFPSLINEKRPKDEDIDVIEGASYRVMGAVENVYASLVVLLGYTNTFIRTHQWQNQAQYEMGKGEICGFQHIDKQEGEIELVLYFDRHTPEPVQLMFRGMFERFLSRRDLEVVRYQTVACHECGTGLDRNVITLQLARGKDFSFCHQCGEKLALPSPEPLTRLTREEEILLDSEQAIVKRRTAFEAALVRVKGLLRDVEEADQPSCFISYAWGIPEHEGWVLQLAKDLQNAGIDVLLDRWHSIPGSNLDLYIERILSSDYVLPVGTPELLKKYESEETDPVLAAELKLINLRVRQPNEYGPTVLPALLSGNIEKSLSPQLRPLVSVDFRESEYYFTRLFDMIWRIYNLPFDNPLLEELKASMGPRRM